MIDTILDRCKQICGNRSDRCFIANKQQVACIVDMVVNKVAGIRAILDTAKGEIQDENTASILDMAVTDLDSLISWVRYLQVVQNLSEVRRTNLTEKAEKRREHRYQLPDECQRYINLTVEGDDAFLPAKLLDFSRHGLRFQTPVFISIGSLRRCILTTSPLIAKEFSFMARIRHCAPTEERFVAGAQIETIDDQTAFEVFQKVYEFIVNMATGPESGQERA